MKTLRHIILTACTAVSVTVFADPVNFTLKTSVSGTDFDWGDGRNYDGGTAPTEGSYVTIPEGVDAKLSADSESWTFVTNTIARILPLTPTSRLVVDVAENTVAGLPCEVTINGTIGDSYSNKGNLTKTGNGELRLLADGVGSYYTIHVVSNGVLTLFQDGVSGDKYHFDGLFVASNAVINAVGNGGITNCRRFSGEGTINGSGTGRIQTTSSLTNKSVFHGVFTGFEDDFLFIASPVELWNTNSTASGVVKVFGADRDTLETGPALGLVSFAGKNDTCGTIGPKRHIQLGDKTPGGVRYLGTGDTVDDFEFNVRGTDAGSFVFLDAGVHGGLHMTNMICQTGTKAAAMHREFILTGTGPVTNSFHCWLRERAADALWCPFHLVKRGPCTWRLHQHKKTDTAFTGGISVEDGILQYDTIAEAGRFCSLGFATNLYEAYTGNLDASRKVSWAISLGAADGRQGTIEYTGTDDVLITNRIIALKGDGRILHNTERKFNYFGFVSSGENAKTLTLDGSGSANNTISDLSDADGGAISIRKAGSGFWSVLHDVSFRGGVEVEEGTLTLCSPVYTWFRFTDQQVYTNLSIAVPNQPSKTFAMREMAFFSAEGISQSIGLQYTDDCVGLQPGQFSYAGDSDAEVNGIQVWDYLFDDTAKHAQITLGRAPVLEDESTWMPLVFRMPVDAEAVASFDMVWNTSGIGKGACYHPAAFKMEASADGVNWTEIFSTNNVVSPGQTRWLKDSGKFETGDLAAAETDETKRRHGFIFEQPSMEGFDPEIHGPVSVASGATLRSSGGRRTVSIFRIDMSAGGGTLKGFDFAENGTIHLVNVPEGTGNLKTASFTPVNCTGTDNISNWTLLVDGVATTKDTVTVSADGTVRLTTPALRVIIR